MPELVLVPNCTTEFKRRLQHAFPESTIKTVDEYLGTKTGLHEFDGPDLYPMP